MSPGTFCRRCLGAVHDGECPQLDRVAELAALLDEIPAADETPTRCLILSQAQVVSRLLHPLLDSSALVSPNGLNATPLVERWNATRGSPPRTAHAWGPLGYVDVDVPLDDMAAFVRLCSVPSIVDAIVGLTPRSSVEAFAGVYEAFDQIHRRMHHMVLADALLARGHWLGEPLALWLTRPCSGQGSSRVVWGRTVARKFVLACPAESDTYVVQGDVVGHAPEGRWSRIETLVQAGYVPTMRGVEVAAKVDSVLRKVHGHPCHFTLTLQNDRMWLVGIPYIEPSGYPVRQVIGLPTRWPG